ncbi:MAG: hypothetical protein SGARI_005840, partial [Bacillariaceae sp.]
ALLLIASIFTAQAKTYLAQGLYETAKNRVEQVMICLGNERVRRGIGSPVPYLNGGANHKATDWSLTMARAQVVLGCCYQHLRRPDWSMRCFQDALHIQRYILGNESVQVAETLRGMGDLHLSQCMLGPAAGCYQEALRVYRYVLPLQQGIFHLAACVAADTATILTSLGWISLLQHDLSSAWNTTMEALRLATRTNGKHHRNVASIRYQLGWIQWWSNPTLTESPSTVLSDWKRVLKHQEQALKRVPTRHEQQEQMNEQDSDRNFRRRRHVDLAKTLHAIGHAYHAAGRPQKSQHAMNGAEEIYKTNLPPSSK